MTRPFRVVECQQRTPEWFQARAGLLTGSAAGDMLATIKSGEAAGRRDLRTRLVVERLTGLPQEDTYINAAMQWGIDHESDAFNAYEAQTGEMAVTTGFLRHTELMAGASLDGHVGDVAIVVSLKCPKSATHLRYLRAGGMPSEHVPQMLHELWLTGAGFYDFLSFDPRFPAELRTFYVRVPRDPKAIADYEQKALAFLAECDREVEAVRTIKNPAAQLHAAIEATA